VAAAVDDMPEAIKFSVSSSQHYNCTLYAVPLSQLTTQHTQTVLNTKQTAVVKQTAISD